MALLKKYNLLAEVIGESEIPDDLLSDRCCRQLLKDYLVAHRNNQRQWSASTKGRSEIANSNAKPRPQKGSGNARQGTLKAPQFRGGGIVFGPKPKKNQSTSLNKKEKRAVFRYLLSEKIRSGSLVVISDQGLKEGKTSRMAKFCQSVAKGSKLLLAADRESVCPESIRGIYRSSRNLPSVNCCSLHQLHGYDILRHSFLCVAEGSEKRLIGLLNGESR